jgi:Fe/S biogenesis protein NfuA
MDQIKIQKFVDDDINPALEMHGGFLSIESFDEDKKILEIKLGGGCQGCVKSQLTLKLAIETSLKEEFPQITEIKDLTDHSAGMSPYFTG